MQTKTPLAPEQKHENGLKNILINVIIPILILNKLSSRIGPKPALLLAISLPLVYGLTDLIRKKKTNYFSILGLINISVTGSLAILRLDGMWFAVKEAAFPILIGIFVVISSWTENPFIKSLLLNPQLMHLDVIHNKLEERGEWLAFNQHLRVATRFLALTFIISAMVNFMLALQIFIPIDVALDESAHAIILNEQIAKMTMWAAAVIILPSMLMLSGILWYLLKGIRQTTGLLTDQILKS